MTAAGLGVAQCELVLQVVEQHAHAQRFGHHRQLAADVPVTDDAERPPRTSWLPVADLSQVPACNARSRSISRRARLMISAIASSTTLRVLEYGELNTATPRSPLRPPGRCGWYRC